ncbi:ABC transporter permease subunit [Achromobacter arsenitoxydans]|uniref:ABC transporter permease n=1 Tax=Achromobacter arsenitoxydans SY8 TaxID=477184 RepID=H0F2D5_9BURK|nr:ABC transporter permease subunit [Achromobacter arsenitoxydans]EHK67546.1 ABC transporter permease [Achromobacter arsenitoxydans SY8]
MHDTQFRRFGMVLRHELRLLTRERALWVCGLLFLLLVGYAIFNGMLQTSLRDQAQAALMRADAQNRASQLAQLNRIMDGTETPTPFGNPASPANMGGGLGAHYAVMPSLPLAPVALGQTDLFPSQFKVSYDSKVDFIHNNDIENPWHLLSGHFDLAFVVVYLLPLLIFALGHNLLSGEKEDGTLRLLLSQPLSLATLIGGKVALRALVLLTAAVLVPVAALLIARPQALQAAGPTLWWALLVGAYALFWFAAVVAVNAFGKSSAANAMILMVSWVLLVLVAPVLLNLAAAYFDPAPSRAELATRTRVATALAMRDHAALLSTDYEHMDKPDALIPRDGYLKISGRPLGHARVERQVDAAMQPELDRFDAQMVRQQARIARYSFLSPAAAAFEGITARAGTGQRRHAHFMRQIDVYHLAWKDFFLPRIEASRAISPEDFPRIPVFHWQEEDPAAVRHRALRSLVQLLAPTALLLALACWRLRRYRVV